MSGVQSVLIDHLTLFHPVAEQKPMVYKKIKKFKLNCFMF